MLDRGEAPLLARGEAPFELGWDEVDSGEGDEENFAIMALTPPALGLGGASDLCDSCTDVLCVCCSGCEEEETEASAGALELTRLRLTEEGGGWEEGVGCAGVELARLRLIVVDGCTGVGCAGDSDTLLSNLLRM